MEYRISEKMVSIKPSAIREIFKSLQDPTIISFAAGNPSPETFPVEMIAEISERVYRENPTLALQYGITEGYMPLRELISARLADKFKIDLAGNTTLVTTGGQQGIDLTCKVMCDAGDVVLCESPSFIGALNAFKANGAMPVGIQMDEDGSGINLAALEDAMKKYPQAKLLYLIPTFHNPLGTTMSLEKRVRALELAQRYGILILEDNPYGELRFRGEDIPTIKSMDKDGAVIYCSSFSKILSPAARIGFVAAPDEIAQKIVVAKQVNDVHTNMYFQLICHQFLEKYNIEEHIEKIKVIYKNKCLSMLGEMEKHFPTEVKYTKPDGGLFLWCTLPDRFELKPFISAALAKKVAVVPGNAFLIDENERTTSFRLNYSMPSFSQITSGITLLSTLMHP